MLSISSGHSAEYLTGSVGAGAESYYTGAATAGEPPGRWNGTGAAKLGLAGEVDPELMHEVFGRFADPRDPRLYDQASRHEAAALGRPPKRFRTPDEVVAARIEAYSQVHASTPLPEQVQAWRIEAERDTPKAVMFHDLTYSPVKSVTVLHTALERAAVEATAAGDAMSAEQWAAKVVEIDEAIHVANDAMLSHIAEHAGYARTGRHGAKNATGRWDDAHDWIVASFYQHTSRDLDPQLHIHNAVLNRVECPDGQWRALDSRAIYAAKQGAGAIADRVLEAELTRRLGVSWAMREDGVAREIVGVDQEAMDLFSTRSRTLTKRAEALIADAEERYGRQLTSLERDRLRRQASMATRRAKTHEGESRAEQLDRWNAALRAELAGGLHRIAQRFEGELAAPAAEEWSPAAVIAQAVEACHEGTAGDGRATFGRSELIRQVLLALPDHLGDIKPDEVAHLAEGLADAALAGDLVVQTAGHEIGSEPESSRLSNGHAATIAPGAQRWAAAGHVEAEIALLRSAGIRGRASLAEAAVEEWLAGPGADLSAAQREAVTGLATSDAALAVLVGAAGTGKSHTAGAIAQLWADLGDGGSVIGVATAQVAADVLRDDGVADTANIAAFLAAQGRLADGRPLPDDERLRLGARDVLLVDEASMLDTSALTALRETADAAGARVVLMGDPRQLGAVGAGGLMRTAIDHGAETYTLSEVRRFAAGWERDASLRLRDADPDVVAEYDRRGRIVDGGDEAATIAAVARAAAADRIEGRSALVVAPTNRLAAEVSAGVREYLVAAGLVEERGVVLGRDGCTAGVGDVVQARRIDRGLGLTNRETYRVLGVGDDGALDVVSTATGEARRVPADYVAADVTLAYAGTVHAAQGATVDVGHALVTPTMSPAAAYVGLSRGRDGNTAWCVTDQGDEEPPTTGRGVLSDVISSPEDTAAWSAVDVAEADEAFLRSAATLTGLLEDETRLACRERLDADLEQLLIDGVLSEDDRARFGADQGTEYLSRLLRAHEQAGADPAEVLREAIAARPLTSAHSVAQVVAGRIDASRDLPVPRADDATLPERIPADRAAHLADLTDRLDGRRAELGAELAADPAPWAVATLGPVPEDAAEREGWQQRAGVVAAWREASGWDSPDTAMGRCPGTSTPEKRAQWHEAYLAAGMPEERRPEAEMSDGRLLVRAAAARREEAAAPAFVDEAMREHHRDAADAEREAVLARATGDEAKADELMRRAAEAADAAARLASAAEVRGEWLARSIETREAGRAAEQELMHRGVDPAHAPDRTTADDWLADHAAIAAEDEHRRITERDVTDEDAAEPPLSESDSSEHLDLYEQTTPTPLAADAEMAAIVAAARRASDELADRESHDAAEPADDDVWLQRRDAELELTTQTAAAEL
jgi:conjugative relaxase-like TrwC/TraI family protein